MKNTHRKSKNAVLAVLLNLWPIPMGLGYIYIGAWARFLALVAIQFFSLIPMTMLGLRAYNNYILVLALLISLWDVYRQSKAYNASIVHPNTDASEQSANGGSSGAIEPDG